MQEKPAVTKRDGGLPGRKIFSKKLKKVLDIFAVCGIIITVRTKKKGTDTNVYP